MEGGLFSNLPCKDFLCNKTPFYQYTCWGCQTFLLTLIMIKDDFLKYSTGEPFNTLHCAKGQFFTIPNLRTAQYHIEVGFKV